MSRQHHRLKCWPEFFGPVANGLKTFEIREEIDRKFMVGDIVTLLEYEPKTGQFGSELELPPITYITRGAPFLPPYTCVFSWAETEHYP